ncbi:hypothetical protein BTVI_84563 [Pitangus sulphuratus]|nr:hypothetical protein BTVI_84563 [Pitangus sulphuratus]
MLLLSLMCSLVFGMLSAASVSYSMLAITRTLTGVALSGVSLIVLPLAMEWVDIEHRTFTGILSSIFWSVGNMLLAMVAYLVREWHWLLVAVTGPCLLSIVCLWFGVSFSYYGMSLNLIGFGLNIYLSQFVFGVIEIPAKVIMYVLVNRVGRRQSQAWTLILTGLCIGANVVIPKSFTSLRSVVAIMGKGFSEAAFTTVYLYTSELYPTILRQNGMGYTSFVARLGGALAPLVFLLDQVWRSLPEVTYCSVAVCSGAVAFLLPETLNVCLPEGIEDVEKAQVKVPPEINAPEGMPLQSLLK